MMKRRHKACGSEVHWSFFWKGYRCKNCDRDVETWETTEVYPFWQHIRVVTYKGINPSDNANNILAMLRDGVAKA